MHPSFWKYIPFHIGKSSFSIISHSEIFHLIFYSCNIFKKIVSRKIITIIWVYDYFGGYCLFCFLLADNMKYLVFLLHVPESISFVHWHI